MGASQSGLEGVAQERLVGKASPRFAGVGRSLLGVGCLIEGVASVISVESKLVLDCGFFRVLLFSLPFCPRHLMLVHQF